MIGSMLFVTGTWIVGWTGWRCSRALLDDPGPDSLLVHVVGAYVVACAVIVVWTAALGGFGLPSTPVRMLGPSSLMAGVIGLALAVALVTHRSGSAAERLLGGGGGATSPEAPEVTTQAAQRGVRLAGAFVVLVLVAAMADFVLAFATAPIAWDAMTYHLFLPARWIQASTIEHVPTVFGDNAAAYAPQNGALLFTWSMILLNSDAATNAIQVSAMLATGFGVFFLARGIGSGVVGAAGAASLIFFLEPLREQVYSADVDTWMASFHMSALVFLAAYSRSGGPAMLWIAGLATGLAAGTKTLGLTLGALLFLAAGLLALRRRDGAHLAGFLSLALLAGGFWYVRNLVSYDNPLFPLEFGLGPLHFDGVYGIAELRASEFHLEPMGAVVRNLVRSFGWLQVLLLGAATVGLGWAALAPQTLSHRPRATPGDAIVARLLLVVGVLWGLWFLLGVPHNTEERFVLPAVLALVPGIALPLHALAARWPALAIAVMSFALSALLWTRNPLARWGASIEVLGASRASLMPIALLSALVLGGWAWLLIAGARRCTTHKRFALLAGAIVASALFCSVATEANEESRVERIRRSDFAGWLEGVEFLYEREGPPMTIAYSGGNVPYILVGKRFKNRVVYVNTRGEPGDGFYEHWVRDGRRRYRTYKPGLYRVPAQGPQRWLLNLEQEGPDWVHLFALHPFERAYLEATPDGFPVESAWMRDHSTRFEPVFSGTETEVFRVRRSRRAQRASVRLPPRGGKS